MLHFSVNYNSLHFPKKTEYIANIVFIIGYISFTIIFMLYLKEYV